MNIAFKSYLLATSCLVMSLAFSSSSIAMGKEEDLGSSSGLSVRPDIPMFNIQRWGSAFIGAKDQEKGSLLESLKGHADAGNSEAQEKIYELSVKDFLGKRLISPKDGKATLDLGWAQEKLWAAQYIAKNPEDPRRREAHLFLYNRDISSAKSEAFLDDAYQYSPRIRTEYIQAWTVNSSLKQRSKLARAFKTKWENLPYAKPFYDMYLLLKERTEGALEVKDFLEIAAQKGHLNCMTLLGGQEERSQPAKALQLFTTAADKGHTLAAFNAGRMYANRGQAPDREQAIKYYTMAVDNGDIESMVPLGDLLRTTNPKRAEDLYRKAALKDYVVAMYSLGNFLKDTNPTDAEFWYRKAIKRDHVDSMFNLGVFLRKTKPLESIDCFKKAAHHGDLMALIEVGNALRDTNPEEAEFWYREAVKKKSPRAKFALGGFLQETRPLEAIDCFKEAAQEGDIEAPNNLGSLLRERDNAEAMRCYRDAYSRGSMYAAVNLAFTLQDTHPQEAERLYREAAPSLLDAKNFLGAFLQKRDGITDEVIQCYTDGDKGGCMPATHNLALIWETTNPKEAERLYRKAAPFLPEAKNNLGVLIQPRNSTEAFKYYSEAAAEGSITAMFNLGTMYETGYADQAPDLEKAIDFYEQAAEKDYTPAFTALGRCYLEKSKQDKQYVPKAYVYLEKAQMLGDLNAAILLQQAALPEESEVSTTPAQDEELTQAIEESLKTATTTTITPSEPLTSSSGNQDKETASFAPMVPSAVSSSSSLSSADLISAPLPEPLPAISLSSIEEASRAVKSVMKEPKNPKYIRQQLRESKAAVGAVVNERQYAEAHQLTAHSRRIVGYLQEKNFKKITDEALTTLFADPYFRGDVEVKETSNGIKVTAINYVTKEVAIASDHRVHRDQADGHHPNFIKKINEILGLFGITGTV